MTDGEWRPPQDLVDWLDALHNSLQALLASAAAGDVTNAQAGKAIRDLMADMPGPAGAVTNELMTRIEVGEELTPGEAHQTILAAITHSGTDR